MVSLVFLPSAPGIGDSAEFTLALALAGIPHPTGYPFYVLAGHRFVLAAHALGLGWAEAANLWSALGAAVAAIGLARLIRQATGSRAALPQLLPVTLLAWNPVWVLSATVAEVYSWSHAWIAVAGAFVLGRLRALDDPALAERLSPARTAFAWGVLCGVGAGHHATMLFFAAPGSLALLAGFVRARRGGVRDLLPVLSALPIYLLGAAWLWWRAAHPVPEQWPLEPTPTAVIAHLRASVYSTYLGGFRPNPLEWSRIRDFLLPWILPGLAVVAVFALTARARPVRWGLLALAAGAVGLIAFLVRYGVPDPAMFFVPALMVSMVAVAVVVDALSRRTPRWVAWAVGVALAAVVALWALPPIQREQQRIANADARIRAAWALIPFERGIVLWGDDHAHRLWLMQLLEGQRPGLIVEVPGMLGWPLRRESFARRAGFEALGAHELRTTDDLGHVPEWIRAGTTLPVVEFPTYLEQVPRPSQRH